MLRHSSCRRVRVCVRVRGRRLHPAEAYQIICGTRTSACEATWLRLRGPGLVPGGPAAPPEPVIVAVTPEQQQLRLRCEGVRVTLLFDPPEPTRIRMVVKEDSEVVLNCSASGSVTDQIFDWKKDKNVEVFIYSKGITYGSDWAGQSPQFVGRVAHFPEALDLGNASIRIKKAEVRDSGIYTCTFPHPAPVLRSEISLVVECILKVRPPGEGASPEPLIRTVDGGPDRALLQCEVKGAHPRPAVQWQDSSGRVLPAQETESEERDGRFYVTVRANVSRSGDYSCVVTQEEFCHQINSTTFVYIEPTRIRMVVKEDSEVVLNCSASGSVRDQVFNWRKDKNVEVFLYSWGSIYESGQFAGRVAHFPEALDLGNASIRIKKAEVRDSGIYTCTVPRSSPVPRSEISLLVGASPEPLIRKIDQTISRERLQCEVKGARPRPAVQWQDSSGRVLPAQETESEERDGRFYVTVRAIVSRSDTYSCVVTQEELCHQINSTTFVYIVKFHQNAQEAAAQQTGCDIIA
ncbi:hemicentin-1-like isoform X2 [Takifugu flavidus]|uniref:hemicentin-1-like isoform X2 n=1 Tax=Takifugu flavidus TaxID=433684 RepID=UPI00254454D0|nr:hemicentin-1-like isoform X2 [Takifugu flavidus]